MEQIEDEKSKSRNIELLQEQLHKSKPILCNQFLNDLLMGLVSPFEILDKSAGFDIDILSKCYMIASIRCAYPAASSSLDYSEYLKADAVISNTICLDNEILIVKRNLEEWALIFKGNDSEQLEESMYRVAQSIQYEVERHTQCSVAIGIGCLCSRLQEIAVSYRDACIARDSNLSLEKNRIIGINDISAGNYDMNTLVDKPDIMNLLRYGRKSDIPGVLSGYINSFKEIELRSSIFLYYLFMNVIVTCGKYINEMGGDIGTVLPMFSKPDRSYMVMEHVEQLEGQLRAALEKVFDFRDNHLNNKCSNTVARAKEYIDANFTSTQLSLNTVAQHVNISPSHLSTLFSQATGETFIEYLIGLRIKKAINLLMTTSMKSSEIACEVGYNDPHYFSFCFRKETGKTPSEYRQRNNQTAED